MVDIILLPPLDERVEHKQRLLHVEFPRAQEAQQVVVVVLRVVRDVVILNVLPEVLQRPLLLLAHVVHKPRGNRCVSHLIRII